MSLSSQCGMPHAAGPTKHIFSDHHVVLTFQCVELENMMLLMTLLHSNIRFCANMS